MLVQSGGFATALQRADDPALRSH